MRLPVPNFSLAGSSTANCWALPLPHIEAAMQDTSTRGPSAIDGTRTVDPGAMYMEPPPSGFSDVEHPDIQAWADRVAADVVSRRTKECSCVKVRNLLCACAPLVS